MSYPSRIAHIYLYTSDVSCCLPSTRRSLRAPSVSRDAKKSGIQMRLVQSLRMMSLLGRPMRQV